jgi:hypothetical protein
MHSKIIYRLAIDELFNHILRLEDQIFISFFFFQNSEFGMSEYL